jgi:hypothetical protein
MSVIVLSERGAEVDESKTRCLKGEEGNATAAMRKLKATAEKDTSPQRLYRLMIVRTKKLGR